MSEQQILEVQQGIWIDASWLKKAGNGSSIEIVIELGEIRIQTATFNDLEVKDSQDGWDVFLSLEADAPVGKLQDVSSNPDRYLYNKE